MSNNSFAYLSRNPNSFIVQNISSPQKTIRIFNYPILHGDVRDIIAIPGIAESDIRASLLKGELRIKLINKEILVLFSDIDLLQFNDNQYDFLTNAGITKGLLIDGTGDHSQYVTQDVFNAVVQTFDQRIDDINTEIQDITTALDGYHSGDGYSGPGTAYYLKQNIVPIGVKNGINRQFFTPDVFLNGMYKNNILSLAVFLNGRLLIQDMDYTIENTNNQSIDGFDTINFTGVIPEARSNVMVYYAVAVNV